MGETRDASPNNEGIKHRGQLEVLIFVTSSFFLKITLNFKFEPELLAFWPNLAIFALQHTDGRRV